MSKPVPAVILFVGGDDPDRAALARALRDADFDVKETRTAGSALELMREGPELIVLAGGLPEPDEAELCRAIKADPRTAAIPVLHLAGLQSHSAAWDAQRNGQVDGCLLEPVDPHELLGHVHALLRLGRSEAALQASEARLLDSEALYHSLVESLPVCLLRKDLHGRFTFANRAFCTALKKPLSEIVGKTDFDFYPGELAGKYLQDDRRVVETAAVIEDVEEHRDPDGSTTYVQVLKAPLLDSHGQVIGVQGVYWDVTPHKRAEAEVGRAAAEFGVARRIQQKLFPRTVPHLPGLDIAVASFGFDIGGASYPADAIGGDYYDFVPLRDGGLGVAIGDVSGHGVGPAMLMAEVRAFFRAFAQTESSVGAILGLMNRVLLPDIDEDRFVTLLLARLDPHTRRFSYASAGHQPGFILDAAGAVRHVLESTGTPLGLFPENTFPEGAEFDLVPGDLVLLVTDGVMDARDPNGARFGVQRTLDLVRAHRGQPSGAIVENLYHGVRAFGQTLPQYDDVTATVIKVAEAAPSEPAA